MGRSVRAFLDTSALFAGIWSDEGGARMILHLGEVGAIQIVVSPQVLKEADGALKRKAPTLLPLLAILIDRSRAEVSTPARGDEAERLARTVGHSGDARVLADAAHAHADYFVTLDREHFLERAATRKASPIPMGTPGDFLLWFRERMTGRPDR